MILIVFVLQNYIMSFYHFGHLTRELSSSICRARNTFMYPNQYSGKNEIKVYNEKRPLQIIHVVYADVPPQRSHLFSMVPQTTASRVFDKEIVQIKDK